MTPLPLSLVLNLALVCACSDGSGPADSTQDAGIDVADAHDGGSDADAEPADGGWAVWDMRSEPVFAGQYGVVAGDPSVIRKHDRWLMYYTCYAADISGADTCLAESTDGLAWTDYPTGDALTRGRVLYPGGWDGAHETPFAMEHDGKMWLFYTGYADAAGGIFGADSAPIGLSISEGLADFAAYGTGPLIDVNPAGLNAHGMTSPSIATTDEGFMIVFAGWCLTSCPGMLAGENTAIMHAVSTDLLTWTVIDRHLLSSEDVPWVADGLAEPFFTRGPDGRYYLFFTALDHASGHAIGLAVSDTPTGPWSVSPTPLVVPNGRPWTSGGLVAPHAFFDSDRVRMWFSGEEKDEQGNTIAFRTGYAEATLPLAP